jgi:hypothetical protein
MRSLSGFGDAGYYAGRGPIKLGYGQHLAQIVMGEALAEIYDTSWHLVCQEMGLLCLAP